MDVETTGQIKGTALLSVLEFARKSLGADSDRRVLESLPRGERERIGGMIVPMRWYPLSTFAAMLRALDETSDSGRQLAYERGVWSARQQMSTVFKVLISDWTVPNVLAKADRLWARLQSSGQWRFDWVDGSTVRATCSELGIVDPSVCATLRGWMAGLVQLCGHKKVDARELECRCRGAERCVFEIRWR